MINWYVKRQNKFKPNQKYEFYFSCSFSNENFSVESIFSLSGFSFTYIHNSHDSMERGSLSPLYFFHLLHRHLGNSWAITAKSSRMHRASTQGRTGTFGFRAQVGNHLASHP